MVGGGGGVGQEVVLGMVFCNHIVNNKTNYPQDNDNLFSSFWSGLFFL